METTHNESAHQDVTSDAAPRGSVEQNQPAPPQAQLAQGEPGAAPPPTMEGGRTVAVTASTQDSENATSVLGEFLVDGPPEMPDEGTAGEQRPVPTEQAAPDEPPAAPGDGEAPPTETAAEGGPADSGGGTSFYNDAFGATVPGLTATPLPADLAGTPLPPEADEAVFVAQFGAPLVLSSLPAAEVPGLAANVPVPPVAPAAMGPTTEQDPLTELRLAQGGFADDDSEADTITGTPGDDILTGGAGADVFAFSTAADEGDDVITDFAEGSGGDTLRFSDVADENADGNVDLGDLDAEPANTVSGDADDITIGLASGTTITLAGLDGNGLDSFADLANSGVNVDVG